MFGERGTTYDAITKEELNNIKIPYPPLSEQNRIATVLSWFDDLIENKKRQNDVEARRITEDSFIYVHRDTGKELTSLEVLIKGLCKKQNMIEFINDFIIYEKSGQSWIKKIAMYRQFYTVRKAILRTIECITKGNRPEERRIGVVWHTQGTGKSLTIYKRQ